LVGSQGEDITSAKLKLDVFEILGDLAALLKVDTHSFITDEVFIRRDQLGQLHELIEWHDYERGARVYDGCGIRVHETLPIVGACRDIDVPPHSRKQRKVQRLRLHVLRVVGPEKYL